MILDDREITVRCVKCKHTFREKIGILKTSPKIFCPSCGVIIAVDGRQLNDAQKAVADKLEEIRNVVKSINNRKSS